LQGAVSARSFIQFNLPKPRSFIADKKQMKYRGIQTQPPESLNSARPKTIGNQKLLSTIWRMPNNRLYVNKLLGDRESGK
jgi:hypothetical protein